MTPRPVPYLRTIFVCTNTRGDGERVSCGKAGEALCQALKDEISKRGLKGKIRAMKSGCHDFCEEGPNVMIFPDGTLCSQVAPEDLPRLVDKYLA
jgi:(2Fe-2S) ferredoxin